MRPSGLQPLGISSLFGTCFSTDKRCFFLAIAWALLIYICCDLMSGLDRWLVTDSEYTER